MNPGSAADHCPGVQVTRFEGVRVITRTLPCIAHDEHGNHLVRDPNTGGQRWCPR